MALICIFVRLQHTCAELADSPIGRVILLWWWLWLLPVYEFIAVVISAVTNVYARLQYTLSVLISKHSSDWLPYNDCSTVPILMTWWLFCYLGWLHSIVNPRWLGNHLLRPCMVVPVSWFTQYHMFTITTKINYYYSTDLNWIVYGWTQINENLRFLCIYIVLECICVIIAYV